MVLNPSAGTLTESGGSYWKAELLTRRIRKTLHENDDLECFEKLNEALESNDNSGNDSEPDDGYGANEP
jgi:hypothetical protein